MSAQGLPQDEGGLVPYAPRARRMSSMISPVLPTEANALPLLSQSIPEEGAQQQAIYSRNMCQNPSLFFTSVTQANDSV